MNPLPLHSQSILQRYIKPLELHFNAKEGQEEYRYPDLLVDQKLRESVIRSASDWSLPRQMPRLEFVQQLNRNAIVDIKTILEHSIQKFRYGETPVHSWRHFLRFSGDQVTNVAKYNYLIYESKESKWEAGLQINRSKEVAQDWFLNELLPILGQSETAHTAFVTGSPGCGKSSFLKYLLTIYGKEIKEKNIIPSRFEFLKFKRDWLETKKSTKKIAENDLKTSFQNYLSFIHLRDVFLNYFFINAEGQWEERFNYKRSSEKLREAIKRIASIWRAKCSQLGLNNKEGEFGVLERLYSDCNRSKIDYHNALRGLGHKRRLALLQSLNQSSHVSIVTIFDGVDYISVEDMLTEDNLTPLLSEIVQSRSEICAYYERESVGWSTASVIVMRQNTLGFLIKKDSTGIREKDIYFTGAIDPRVALLNALQRSLETSHGATGLVPGQKGASHLMRAVESTILALPAGSGKRSPRSAVYALFCGNLRHVFEFLRVLFDWIVSEAERERLLTRPFPATIEAAIEKLTSLEVHRLLRKRNYRIVELILLPRLGWFENACRVLEHDDFTDGNIAEVAPRVFANEAHAGFMDNIFNYHTFTSAFNPDSHALLEKIRILQILQRKPLNQGAIKSELLRLFGFATEELKRTLVILLKSQMIEARIDFTGKNSVTNFELTGKGAFALNVLLFNMAYLEHVFHSTLFPTRLLRQQSNDQPRKNDIFQWSVRSINNVFVFIAYIDFVENNRAGGRAVPDEFRISSRMSRCMARTIEKILRSASRAHEHEMGADRPQLEDEAWRRIEGQINIWRINGILNSAN